MVSVEVQDTEPTAHPPGVSGRWPWHRVAVRLTFGVSSATSRRGLVFGGVALFAAGVLLWSLGLTGLWSPPDRLGTVDQPSWLHLLTLALAALAVPLFVHRPAVGLGLGATAAAADAAVGGSLGVLVAMWELLFCVGMLGSERLRRAVNLTVTLIVVVASVGTLVIETDLPLAVVTGAQFAVVLAVPLWWAATVRQGTELAELAAQRSELRRTEAVQAERSAIARDLHDAIASRLSTIAIHSAGALEAPGRDQTDAMRAVRMQALEALQEMRSMIVVLRSGPGHSVTPHSAAVVGGGLDQVADLVDAARAAGLRVGLDLPAERQELTAMVPVVVAQAVHRIVQEALANAAKHAPGSETRVSVVVDGAAVLVEVDNTLTTSAVVDHPAMSAGAGLVTMDERATALGGRFSAGPDATTGQWHVAATLPLPHQQRAGVTR